MDRKKQVKVLAQFFSDAYQKTEKEKRAKLAGGFLAVLKEKQMFYLLPEILKELKNIQERKKIVLTLARDFSKEEVDKIKNELKKHFGAGSIFQIKIDNKIIGGFTAKSQNILINGSIKEILNKIKNYGRLRIS